MTFKLAKTTPEDKIVRTISIDEIQKEVEAKGAATFYLDKDCSLKDAQKMRQILEKSAKSVHFNELRYGLDKDSFLYELHIINLA